MATKVWDRPKERDAYDVFLRRYRWEVRLSAREAVPTKEVYARYVEYMERLKLEPLSKEGLDGALVAKGLEPVWHVGVRYYRHLRAIPVVTKTEKHSSDSYMEF